jgi:hypothetical protein
VGRPYGTVLSGRPGIAKRRRIWPKAHLSLTPQQLSQQLEDGLRTISQDVIDTVAALLPKGNYPVQLFTTKPLLMIGQKPPISLSCQADYY